MPPIPPTSNAPYDTVNSVLDLARTRLNDAIQSLGGDVLTNTQPYTQTMANGAWRRLQDILTSFGVARFKKSDVIYSIPAVGPIPPQTVVDPGSSVWINWTQYFDGYNYFSSPTLPRDFITPLNVKERLTAQPGTNPGKFYDMDRMVNGLPTVAKKVRNWAWQWKDETLSFPGATSVTDLWIYYESYLPDFANAGTLQWYDQLVSIALAKDALAWLICYEASEGRGDVDRETFNGNGRLAAQILADRELQELRAIDKTSEYGKMVDRFTPMGQSAPTQKGS